jgi:hypothetical protein
LHPGSCLLICLQNSHNKVPSFRYNLNWLKRMAKIRQITDNCEQ